MPRTGNVIVVNPGLLYILISNSVQVESEAFYLDFGVLSYLVMSLGEWQTAGIFGGIYPT